MACYTVKDAKDLWDYAKEKYLRVPGPHGYPDFKELTHALSDDIFNATKAAGPLSSYPKAGQRIVPAEIAKLLSTPKRVRGANKHLLMAARNRAMILNQARNFVTGNQHSPLARAAIGLYNAPYALKVFGHAAALHMTHAWPYFFDPKMWKIFGKTWVHSWQAGFPLKGFANAEAHAAAIRERIMLGSNFDEQVRSGLAVDPRKVYDDVQTRLGFFGKFIDKTGRMSANSFLGLKELRSMAWDAAWDKVPEHLKTDEMRVKLSNDINHMTGAPGMQARRSLTGPVGETMRALAFAPSLDVARVARVFDILQHAGTEIQTAGNRAAVTINGKEYSFMPKEVGKMLQKAWGESTPEQQWMARYKFKQWARAAGVGTAVLFANQMMLKNIFGSDEDVNADDYDKADWLAVKAPDGSILQATGGQVPMLRMVARAVTHPGQAPSIVGQYVLGKLNPILGIAYTLGRGWGFGGTEIPAPFGRKEATPGNWAEFVFSELGPISTEEGIHEFAEQMSEETGVPQEFNERFLRSVWKAAVAIVPAALGTHYYKPSAKPRGSRAKDEGVIIGSPR